MFDGGLSGRRCYDTPKTRRRQDVIAFAAKNARVILSPVELRMNLR
jgi:hypothetical protein